MCRNSESQDYNPNQRNINNNNSKRLINKNIVNSVVPHEVICVILQFFSNVCTYQLLRNNPPKERLITVF